MQDLGEGTKAVEGSHDIYPLLFHNGSSPCGTDAGVGFLPLLFILSRFRPKTSSIAISYAFCHRLKVIPGRMKVYMRDYARKIRSKEPSSDKATNRQYLLHHYLLLRAYSARVRRGPRHYLFTLSMPHHIFEIDKLARLISRHLVSTHCTSAVSLASTCRFLEEPAFSSLWEVQDWLNTLFGVSPTIMIKGEICDRSSL